MYLNLFNDFFSIHIKYSVLVPTSCLNLVGAKTQQISDVYKYT